MRAIPAEMGNGTKPYVVFIPIKLYESDLIFGAKSLAKDCGAVRCSTCIGFGPYGDIVVYSIWPYWLSTYTGFGRSSESGV